VSPSTGSGSAQPSLIAIVILVAAVGFVIWRRTRRQMVRPARAITISAIIVALSLFGLISGASGNALPFLFAPVALVAGFALGWVMMGTIRFWRDEHGQLWMQGGILYIAIWLATYLLRLGVGYAVEGPKAFSGAPVREPATPLGALAVDLLFVSIGLWIARAAALVRRARLSEVKAAAP
jgi:LPXTG-motif cell wall-anchored protein